jgi:hypothetical protein
MVNCQFMRSVLGRLLSPIVLVCVFSTCAPLACAQDFTLTSSGFSPRAVDPGVPATANINVQPVNSTSAPTVSLSCTVTPVVTNGPSCAGPPPQPSPSSVTAPGLSAVTLQTNGAPQITYNVAVTGTDASGTQTLNLSLTIVAVSPGYTLVVTTPLNPSSVQAGGGTSGVVTLTPLNGYTGGPDGNVYLSCSSITPALLPSPQCSFSNKPNGVPMPVSLKNGAPAISVITINTAGTTTRLQVPRGFYALWLLLPGLLLAGVSSRTNRAKRLSRMSWLALITFASSILFLAACGGQTNNPAPSTSPTSSGTTPNNTYTFTLTGADASGLAPSNTSPTVQLTVN